MSLIVLNNVKKSFGERKLFEGVTFKIEENTRMGFIGANGAGKTTLFNIMLGNEDYEGEIYKSSELKIGIMEQTAPTSDTLTAYEYTLGVFNRFFEIENELEEIRIALEQGKGDMKRLINRQDALNNEYLSNGGMTFRSRTRSLLLGLGLLEGELSLPLASLSGGQKTRLSLARTLLSEANFMMLDEPTNHLDIDAVSYLEEFLKNSAKAFIVISHDRYFLDRVTNTTIELENKKITCYTGAYSEFIEKKEQAHEAMRRKYENTMKEINRLEEMVELQHRWNRERNIRMAESKQKSIDRLQETLEKPEEDNAAIRFSFTPLQRSGNDVLSVKGLSKDYDGKKLFKNVSFEIKRGECVFLLGANGCGKSTLYKIIKGELSPDSGEVHFGTKVDCAYYDQDRSDISGTKDVESELWDVYPKMNRTEIRNALAAFLFRGDDVQKQTSALSGGEKARLSLLEIMLTGANFLLLDEPTNHLDIRSKEALEGALREFDATIFVISHDRYLINKMADKLLVFENGTVKCYDMNYDRYLEYCRLNPAKNDIIKEEKNTKQPNDYMKKKELQGARNKLLGKIRRAEEEISEREDSISNLHEEINNAGSDFEKITQLSALLAKEEDELETAMQQWEQLNAELEEL